MIKTVESTVFQEQSAWVITKTYKCGGQSRTIIDAKTLETLNFEWVVPIKSFKEHLLEVGVNDVIASKLVKLINK